MTIEFLWFLYYCLHDDLLVQKVKKAFVFLGFLIIKEVRPEYSLEGLMLKLKLQYFGHLIRRADSFEKTVMLGKIERMRRRG